jgi:Holliday junction resolvase RusA-like endonuclease
MATADGAITTVEFAVYGQVPSKSNCYKIVDVGGHSSLAKRDKLIAYELQFFRQCPIRGAQIKKPFKLDMDVYYSSHRPDLDNSLKIVLDCLQTCRAIVNDRECMEIHVRKLIDRQNPRIECTLTVLL